jgi:hypothetical protein
MYKIKVNLDNGMHLLQQQKINKKLKSLEILYLL